MRSVTKNNKLLGNWVTCNIGLWRNEAYFCVGESYYFVYLWYDNIPFQYSKINDFFVTSRQISADNNYYTYNRIVSFSELFDDDFCNEDESIKWVR